MDCQWQCHKSNLPSEVVEATVLRYIQRLLATGRHFPQRMPLSRLQIPLNNIHRIKRGVHSKVVEASVHQIIPRLLARPRRNLEQIWRVREGEVKPKVRDRVVFGTRLLCRVPVLTCSGGAVLLNPTLAKVVFAPPALVAVTVGVNVPLLASLVALAVPA